MGKRPMILDPELQTFRKSRVLLLRKGITDRGMEMVLFTMLAYGYSYSEAVKMWAEFKGKGPREMGWYLDAVVRSSGLGDCAAVLLNEMYREEILDAH